jgi:excisionase family DNA binding protein
MDLLNLKEGAQKLRISTCTTRRLIKTGKLPCRRVGTKIFFLSEDIEGFVQKCLVLPNNQEKSKAKFLHGKRGGFMFSIGQVTKMLNVSEITIRRLVRTKRIQHRRIGRRILFTESDINSCYAKARF